MVYIPVDRIRVAALSQVKGPALFWTTRPGRDPMLVTAEADSMFIIVSGDDLLRSGRIADLRLNGYVVEGLQFELDQTSQFLPAYVDEPLGAIIIGPAGVRISTVFRDRNGFDEVRDFPLLGELKAGDQSQDVGFTRWRAVIGEGSARITVLEFESTKKGNR